MAEKLVIGAAGQLGIELVLGLQNAYGADSVHIADIRVPNNEEVLKSHFLHLDTTDEETIRKVLEDGNYEEVYQLAAMLSVTGEKKPLAAWDLNMKSLLNVLEAAKDGLVKRIFWPSSIAVFGPSTPKVAVPQAGPLDPTTVYGISKQSGEYWCRYYRERYGVDIRSIRYPGLIGHRSTPGGGTTDYAVEIYDYAVQEKPFTCFLNADQVLPMMYMEDAVRGTIELMATPAKNINVQSSYNLHGMSFSPAEISESIQQSLPNFQVAYNPDQRQLIAASWPESINDQAARSDWGWKPAFNLERLTQTMLTALRDISAQKKIPQ